MTLWIGDGAVLKVPVNLGLDAFAQVCINPLT